MNSAENDVVSKRPSGKLLLLVEHFMSERNLQEESKLMVKVTVIYKIEIVAYELWIELTSF